MNADEATNKMKGFNKILMRNANCDETVICICMIKEV